MEETNQEVSNQQKQIENLANTEFETKENIKNERENIFQESSSTPEPKPSLETPKPSYSPNKSFMFNLIDTVIAFIEDGKTVEKELTEKLGKEVNIATITNRQIDEYISSISRDNPNSPLKPLLEKYKVMKEKFENVEQQILIEASEQFGFGDKDYFIKPLKDLIDLIKEKKGKITIEEATLYLGRLAKLIAINQAIQKIPIIPYVGPVINGIIDGLDSYSSTKATLTKFLDMLQKFGVPSCELDEIRSYTKDTFFTRKYELFKDWLVNGADFDIMYPFSIFGNIKEKALTDVNTFFNNYHNKDGKIVFEDATSDSKKELTDLRNDENNLKKTEVDNTNSQLTQLLEELQRIITENKKLKEKINDLTQQTGENSSPKQSPSEPTEQPIKPVLDGNLQKGGFSDWAPIGFVKPKTNKKTRRSIHKINRTIKSYLSRLRRTRRKPFRKSVATLNIKRRF
jgi:hypothetical protein